MLNLGNKNIVAVIGGAKVSKDIYDDSFELGTKLARAGFIVLTGGLGGVMEAVSKGAKSEHGLTIGILPGKYKNEANDYIDIPILTAMSHARNAIIVRTADLVIAVDGIYGTLSEIGLALAIEKKVIGYKTFNFPNVESCISIDEAIKVTKAYFKI